MSEPTPIEESAQVSRLAQVRQKERHWLWKAGMRAGLCVIDIVAIGCAAWLTTYIPNAYNSLYWDDGDYVDFPGTAVGSLVVLCIAFIWCLVSLTVPFLLKPARPVHPGVAVGIDLLLWLAFIVAALFTTANIFGIMEYGQGGFISDPDFYDGNGAGYDGGYYLAPNNTWVYNITSTDNGNGYGYDGGEVYNFTTQEWQPVNPTNLSNAVRDCTPAFTSCAQQDALVNRLWRDKTTSEAVNIVVAAIEWLGVLFHFILFVWACVDTHRYNRSQRAGVDQLVADKILADLEKRGLIQVRNGTVVAAGAAPVDAATNVPATAPLLAPIHQEAQESRDAITPL